ncbi:MAG: FAD-binding oxidoreductase [Gemmatimonadota bacterium]|nr:FAD-binding oxidoreductase [Gemmatimonadota bacterium]
MTRPALTDRLRQLLGNEAVADGDDAPPLVLPTDEATCALLLRTASVEGWRVAIVGAGTWMPPPSAADLRLGTARLDALGPVDPADLVATALAGVRWDTLRRGLGDQHVWLAQDAPGGNRTLGSVLATGTTGPLRSGFGPLRDQVLGLSLVTGDGRVLHVGGRVVKNVAGYDLAKLALGTFGAFGVITRVHLRLRAVPRADCTLSIPGTRDDLLEAGREVLASGLTPAALELLSPAAAKSQPWLLAVRLLGSDTEVSAEQTAVQAVLPGTATHHRGSDAAAVWDRPLETAVTAPVTVRVGATPATLDEALDLVALHLDEPIADWIMATLSAGVVRWSGTATPEALRRLRRAAAEHEWPMTLERAPWHVRAEVGHFGAYREGVVRIVQGLRASFDPAGVLVTSIDPPP